MCAANCSGVPPPSSGHVVEHEMHLPADQFGDRLLRGLVGHVHKLCAGHQAKQLAAHVQGAAASGRASRRGRYDESQLPFRIVNMRKRAETNRRKYN
jgi:hypothetical protein